MGQRYIEALSKQAKPDNMFLLKQNVDEVSKSVHSSINLLDLKTDGIASQPSYEYSDEPT